MIRFHITDYGVCPHLHIYWRFEYHISGIGQRVSIPTAGMVIGLHFPFIRFFSV